MEDERTIELLEELVAWTRFSARDDAVRFLKATLTDPKHLTAFEFSDGRSQKEVVEASGLSQPAVSGLWQKWRRLGILREKNGRMVHLVRPSDLGIEIDAAGNAKAAGKSQKKAE